jgi:hypothetical protein
MIERSRLLRSIGPRVALAMTWIVSVALLFGVAALPVRWRWPIADVFFREQDRPILIGCFGLWVLALFTVNRLPAPKPSWLDGGRKTAFILAALVGLVAVVGASLVYAGYALSMDEFMATFDAAIFRHGVLLAPLAPEWRAFAPAMQPFFGLAVPGHVYWSSSYLPVNALFLAAGALVGAPHLPNAVWAAVAVLGVFGVARRLWPDRPDAAIVAAGLLASSSQLLVTAMTPYAMTAHLALNLAWLWLVLRGGRLGHGAAALTAFLATGLHQMIFHPLFAAPFVLQMWLDRRWRVAAFHTAVYAAICLFWILYWSLLLRHAGLAPQASTTLGGGTFIQHVISLLSAFHVGGAALIATNLLRFVAWQNPLAVALAGLAVLPALRAGVPRALVLGFVLTVAATFLVLPFQGHGWGYRYVHGLLGNVCLLAAFGWIRLTGDAAARPALHRLFAAAGAVSLLVLFPVHAWQAHQWVLPYARAEREIQQSRADVVIVDRRGLWYGVDLVRNDPFLKTGPKVLNLGGLDQAGLDWVCGHYRVAMFDKTRGRALGIRPALGERPIVEKRLRPDPTASACDQETGRHLMAASDGSN